MRKITKALFESINSDIKKEAKIVKESEGDIHRVKECKDDIDIITALEGDTLMIEDMSDWEEVKNIVGTFSSSQGFYGRLLRDMQEYEDSGEMEFPIYM